jgi:hypothetical protein
MDDVFDMLDLPIGGIPNNLSTGNSIHQPLSKCKNMRSLDLGEIVITDRFDEVSHG